MAQEMATDDLLETVDSLADGAEDFVSALLPEVVDHLSDNRRQAESMGLGVSASVDDVLSPKNVREIAVRARPLENPKVTFWLTDCPTWGNDAWSDSFYPNGLNAYNGKVNLTIDVRPM